MLALQQFISITEYVQEFTVVSVPGRLVLAMTFCMPLTLDVRWWFALQPQFSDESKKSH